MALTQKSLLLYDFEIDTSNSSLDFRAVSAGPVIMATLRVGFYSLTDLLIELKRAMEAADPLRTYTWTANRTINGGTENRLTVLTSGIYLDLLFSSGPRVATSVAPLLGFLTSDYTGATTYTGSNTAGTALVSERVGYNYIGPDLLKSIFGTVNVSASGLKEAIVWSIQRFLEVEFKYEPESKAVTEWSPFMTWAIQQKPYEFTPEITSPGVFYNVTLESTPMDGKGLGFKMVEMLPDFPFEYKTGILKMRIKELT